jgi:hypothetical protein
VLGKGVGCTVEVGGLRLNPEPHGPNVRETAAFEAVELMVWWNGTFVGLTTSPAAATATAAAAAAVGTNPVQLTRGMDKTVAALVKELAKLSTEVASDKDLANVAAVSAGGVV